MASEKNGEERRGGEGSEEGGGAVSSVMMPFVWRNGSYEVRLEMAVIYEEMGERALAKDSYKESARLKPESVQVDRYRLGQAWKAGPSLF